MTKARLRSKAHAGRPIGFKAPPGLLAPSLEPLQPSLSLVIITLALHLCVSRMAGPTLGSLGSGFTCQSDWRLACRMLASSTTGGAQRAGVAYLSRSNLVLLPPSFFLADSIGIFLAWRTRARASRCHSLISSPPPPTPLAVHKSHRKQWSAGIINRTHLCARARAPASSWPSRSRC